MPDRSAAQRQVGLAVADNCWRYFEAAGDQALLLAAGAELIFEVARHFAYLAVFDEALGRVSRGNPVICDPRNRQYVSQFLRET